MLSPHDLCKQRKQLKHLKLVIIQVNKEPDIMTILTSLYTFVFKIGFHFDNDLSFVHV